MNDECNAGGGGRWVPNLAMRLSFGLHLAAAVSMLAVGVHAGITGGLSPTSAGILWFAAAALVLDHLALTAAGLCPRCSLLGPNLTHLPQAARARGLVSITIDDGPDPVVTPLVLDLLKEQGATASFFLIARRAEQYPALVARIVAEGHSVENHSWSHSHRFAFCGPSRFRAEILRAQHSLSRLAGDAPRFFRAPAGMRNPLLEPVLSRLGLPLTSWTRRGFDTVTGDPPKVLERLIGRDAKRLRAGDILLLHDGHSATAPDGRPVILAVLPQVLSACRRLRLQAVSLRQAFVQTDGADAPAADQPAGSPRADLHFANLPDSVTDNHHHQLDRRLLDAATVRYRPAGRFAYYFARGKLSGDPAFAAILEGAWIRPRSRVLDLGCGQGLLASLLLAADTGCHVRGIELMPTDAGRAKAALGDAAEIVCGDIRHEDFGKPDAVVILDVLHYIDYADQDQVLRRIRAALQPDGVLLLRVGDADAGLPFRFSNWVDWVVTFVRGHRLGRLYCRPLDQWRRTLQALGFRVEVIPLSQGTPFANVLLKGSPLP